MIKNYENNKMSKTKGIEIKLVKNKKELSDVFKIREVVFVKEQNVPRDIEMDEFDTNSKHFIVLYSNKPIGCARIRFIGKMAKLERIALLKRYRGKGFGKIMMNYLIKYCKNKNVEEIVMNAQYYLKNYYDKFGFRPKGKTFMEAGIKHIEMYQK